MTTTAVDVHEELASAKVGPLHWMLAAMMGALTFFDGYDTFNPAYVIHYVAGPWGLAPGQAGLLISSGLVGFLIGAAGHGVFADRFGRRGTLLGGLWITNIFTLVCGLVSIILHPESFDGHRSWRPDAAGDHLHQRTRAAPCCQRVRALGCCSRVGARRNFCWAGRRVYDATVRMACSLLGWFAVDPAELGASRDSAGIREISGAPEASRRDQSAAEPSAT